MALADTPWQLWLSCLLSGLGGTLFDPPRSALVAKLTRPRERSRFYSLLLMQDSAGAVGGALFGSWLLQFDFRWVGLGGAVVFLAAAAANAWLLPAYRVATRRAPAWNAIRLVLGDRRFLKLVLTLSGYYLLSVQIMLLVPIAIKHLTGSAQAVGWMYGLETLLSLTLLYPLARIGERHFRLETRVLAGLALMSLSLACMAVVRRPASAFLVLGVFFLGTIITEPARETLVASLAKPDARASYMGASRLGLALGGGIGFSPAAGCTTSPSASSKPAYPGCCSPSSAPSLSSPWRASSASPCRRRPSKRPDNNKSPPDGGLFINQLGCLPCGKQTVKPVLRVLNIRRLLTLRTGHHFKAYTLTLFQGFEALHVDGRE